MMLVFEKLHLERQNGKQFIHIPLDILDTVFFPRPYLRRDIIIDRDLRLSSQELGNIQVKTGIIHQYHYIRLPCHNILFTSFHIGKDCAQMQ